MKVLSPLILKKTLLKAAKMMVYSCPVHVPLFFPSYAHYLRNRNEIVWQTSQNLRQRYKPLPDRI
jgi:hypothetical protein